MPERTMKVRRASSVCTRRRSSSFSRKEFTSMLAGVGSGVEKLEWERPGVGGEVAEGMV
jgi:hypothetical protein